MRSKSARQLSAGFFSVSERCLTERHCGDEALAIIPVPGIVCGVFSIEIGFKSLLMVKGDAAQGHNLLKLFEKLDSSIQDEIIQGVGLDRASFMNELSEMADSFTQWRYVYEHEEVQINLGFLDQLAKTTQNIALRVVGT
ncbi:hypothetical protein KFJ24_02540 [Marinobacter sediminum]|uniref:hypothetical protein n=1 Tax=Marinobacter sediminum TaxID=256323 RepID=UPI00202FC22A|nr:hypothetical protein [Marinobacter sediminum]MCM0611352.1 hypothetical protein [Marinobacter sediminum]